MTWELYTESEISSSDCRLDTLTKPPPPWAKPFLPQQVFSTIQVLVTRVGKNPKNPKEPEPMAPLYPILQGGIVRGSTLIETAPPWPGTIGTICMSCFMTGDPNKEYGTNKPPPARRVWERSKGDTACPSTSQNPSH